MRGELRAQIDQGRTHEEMISHFIALLRRSALPPGADRQGIQPAGVVRPVPGRRHRPRGGRHDRATLVAEARRQPRPSRQRRRIRPSRNDSTMSSETSTDAVRLKADAADAPSARRSASARLQPWQFFVLAALGCATAALFASRGQGDRGGGSVDRADGRHGAGRPRRCCARCGRWSRRKRTRRR